SLPTRRSSDLFHDRLQDEMSAARQRTSSEVAQATMTTAAVGASALILSILLGAWISMYKISRPLSRMTGRMEALADGHLDADIEGQSRGDEIGAMAKAVQVFKDNALALKAAEAAAEEERKRAEEERARNEAQREMNARKVAEVVAGLGRGSSAWRAA